METIRMYNVRWQLRLDGRVMDQWSLWQTREDIAEYRREHPELTSSVIESALWTVQVAA